MARLEAELQKALLPKDPNDERNLFIEVRAGTGGDESGLFAGDLFRMYSRYAERKGWQVEIISESPSELGGYKEVIARIAGQGAFSKLKFESGGTACSAYRKPRRRAASIPPRARLPCFPRRTASTRSC